jgi:hypothetical protein
MIPEQIEKIKSEYTGQYVVVTSDLPEYARFQNIVGQVTTVNMNGRALVEFEQFNLNHGRFDLDLDYLKVVDQPTPKVKEKRSAAKSPPKTAPTGAATQAETKEIGSKEQPEECGTKGMAGAEGEEKLSPLERARMQGGNLFPYES